jgi:hypothetical protein
MSTVTTETEGDLRLLKRRSSAPPMAVRLHSVRPSLLDTRFRGDAWIVAGANGCSSLYLENSFLVRLELLSFDVAALNGTLQQMRWCRRGRRPKR